HLVPNNYLYIKGNVSYYSNPDGSKKHRISYTDFSDLRDVLEKQSTSIEITLNLNDICDELTQELAGIFTTHNGTKKLNFVILDQAERIKLDLPSRSQKVNICNDLLANLDNLEVEYQLK